MALSVTFHIVNQHFTGRGGGGGRDRQDVRKVPSSLLLARHRSRQQAIFIDILYNQNTEKDGRNLSNARDAEVNDCSVFFWGGNKYMSGAASRISRRAVKWTDSNDSVIQCVSQVALKCHFQTVNHVDINRGVSEGGRVQTAASRMV